MKSDGQDASASDRFRLKSLAFAHGGPLASGRIRSVPEDFIVREWLGFEPSGDGEHLLLVVRKRGANTKWVARQIADRAGVRVREVGFAGLKDRHAVTEQAFTVPALRTTPDAWLGFAGEGFQVIAAARQRRKLRRGAHKGNDFEIVVRDFDVERAALDARLTVIAEQGVPNYFGEQRFGRDSRNTEVAERWLCHGVAPTDRDARGFAISAARSFLFNEVVAARVREQTWNRLVAGEVVNLDGTGSVFAAAEVDAALERRCTQLDLHPTGPLCGRGDSRVTGEAEHLEERILAPWSEWCRGLAAINVEQHRRALRLAVRDLSWSYRDEVLILRFRLTRGAFATAVLRELVQTNNYSEDASGGDHD